MRLPAPSKRSTHSPHPLHPPKPLFSFRPVVVLNRSDLHPQPNQSPGYAHAVYMKQQALNRRGGQIRIERVQRSQQMGQTHPHHQPPGDEKKPPRIFPLHLKPSNTMFGPPLHIRHITQPHRNKHQHRPHEKRRNLQSFPQAGRDHQSPQEH